MKEKVVPALMVVCMSCVANAEPISGFQDFVFGETLAKIEGSHSLAFASDGDEGRWFEVAASVNILGTDYKQSLLFDRKNILIQVNVSRNFNDSDTACSGAFEEVFGAIQAKYGEPDQAPERSVYGGISAITSAKFTQEDGSRIMLSTVYLTDCLVNVAYVAGKGGSGF